MDVSYIALGIAGIFIIAAVIKWMSASAASRRMENRAAAIASGGTEKEPVTLSDPFHEQPETDAPKAAPVVENKPEPEEPEPAEPAPESPYVWE